MQLTPKIERGLLIFTLVDILFAPYVFFIATTYSQLLVFLWFILKDKNVFVSKEVRFYYSIMFFLAVSVLVSFFTLPENLVEEYVVENMKRGLNIGLAISYYFFFYYMLKRSKIKLEKWLFIFVIYVLLWGSLYYLNFNVFLQFKRIFNPNDSILRFINYQFYFYRYSFIWTDPNNIGYALVGVVSFLFINKNTSNIALIISSLSLLFILLISMSGGSVLTAILVIPLTVFARLNNNLSLLSRIIFSVSIFTTIFIINELHEQFTGSEVGETAISRFEDKTQTGEPRLDIWRRAFESKNILLYSFAGEGSMLFINGKPYAPHSGHIMFIFGFGIVCYYMYMFIFFRKSKTQKWEDLLYIVPFFACFTINIGIGELKYAALMYMLIAYSRTYIWNSNLENVKKVQNNYRSL